MGASRRTFLASATALPILHEGVLAALAMGPPRPAEGEPVARLSNNENPNGPCPRAREAITRAIPDGGRYPRDRSAALTRRLAKLHDVSEDMVVLANGSTEVLRMAAGAFLSPQRRLVAASPTYEALGNYARLLGAAESKAVAVTGDDLRHDATAMLAAAGGAGIVYVCNPHNPTASVTPKQEIARMAAGLPSGAVLLVDEAYAHFADTPAFETALGFVKAGRDVVMMRTFSKIYGMAGLRIGYAIARPELAAALRRHALGYNTNLLGMEAALASLDDPDWVARNRDQNHAARRVVTDWLQRHKLAAAPSQANFVFFNTGRPVEPQIEALRARGVQVGRPFPPLTQWMRVSIGTLEEMRRFVREYEAVRT